MNTLDHFERIIALSKENGFSDTFFEAAREHLDAVAGLLHTSPVQTAIFALLLEHFGEYSVSIDNIAETLKCGKIQLIRYMDDIEDLKQKKLIRETSDYRDHRKDSRVEYTIPLDVINAVRNGIGYEGKKNDNLKPVDFFDCADDLISEAEDDDMDRETLVSELKYLYEQNREISFVKKQREYDLDESSMLIMLYLCCALVSRDNETIEVDDLGQIMRHYEVRSFQRSKEAQDHELFARGLVEFECKKGLVDTEYCHLTQRAKDEFLGDVALNEKSNRKGKRLIPAEKITVKQLFYNEKIRGRINELIVLLQEDNFHNIQKRLSENGMRNGFACIFSGPPGTGKTETAYQIAHETGRDIMLVDIAETKSCWYGESEKLIKAVFDQYRGMVKADSKIPILVFNEADAVLGKRRELAGSSGGVDQTENTIQNIILQEMEDLDGILIATTNMTTNLDKAFERRFLYKIEFEKPDIESKIKIWQSLIPSLSDEYAVNLATQFDFSGGQIENIARKSMVSYILNNTILDLSGLEALCREENLEKAVTRIGFNT